MLGSQRMQAARVGRHLLLEEEVVRLGVVVLTLRLEASAVALLWDAVAFAKTLGKPEKKDR